MLRGWEPRAEAAAVLMSLRNLLVALVVVATAAFVAGTSIERSSGESGHYHEATATVKPAGVEKAPSSGVRVEAGGESAATHAREGAVTPGVATTEKAHAELRPLGIDVESWPFVAIAALASMGLALAAWLRPSLAQLLGLVLVGMLVFAALDVSEVVRQSDVGKTGLTVLAGIAAAMHLAAAVVAAAMAARASRRHAGQHPAAGRMPA